MTAYFVLYTQKDGKWEELLNAKQLKKVLGWTGLDFEGLANGKHGETIVLFRVEDHEYNGSHTLQVSWIDTADASPVKTLPKYDASKLKGLTAKLGGALSAAAPVAPASAPAKPATGKPKIPPKGKQTPRTPAASPEPASEAPVSAPSTATPPPAGAPAPIPPAPSASPSTPETKDSAWAAVNGPMRDVSDDRLAEAWIAEGAKIGKNEDQFTPADWEAVKNAVLALTSKF